MKLLLNPFRSMLPKSIQRQSQVDDRGNVLHVEVQEREVPSHLKEAVEQLYKIWAVQRERMYRNQMRELRRGNNYGM